MYMNNSKKLTLTEELELIKDYKINGNLSSKQKVMEDYVEYLEGLCLTKFNDSELLSEAYIVLDDVLQNKFDYKKGVRLITRAYPYIINRIDELLSGTYLNGNIRKVKNRRREFYSKYGYEPTEEELADEYNLNLYDVKTAYLLLDRKNVELTDNIQIIDEEPTDFPELEIPNGLLTQKEKYYLEQYLKGKTEQEMCRERKVKQGYYKSCFNSIVKKMKDYNNREA